MSDVLFATADAGGNVPPLLGVAREMARRGHRVRVLGHQHLRETFERADLDFHPYSDPTPWDPRAPQSNLAGLRGFIHQFTAPDKGRDLAELLDDETIVVADCMLLNVISAALAAGRPTVSLVHSFHAYFDGPWRKGPIGIVARLRGLGARRLWRSCDLVLVCTDRALDPAGTRNWPQSFVWTGPVQPRTPAASPTTPPRVLASLSTNAFPGQHDVVQKILDGLAGAPIELVLTTGPAIEPDGLRVPPNAEVHRFLPHDEVLPSCSAVLGHGGHSTTVKTLAHGLPLVVVPMHAMLDQPMIGRVIEAAGAGVTLRRTATPEQIRTAVDSVLAGSHRQAAASIGDRWRDQDDGAVVAADRILALAPATA